MNLIYELKKDMFKHKKMLQKDLKYFKLQSTNQ
jgi:hypothetical protein